MMHNETAHTETASFADDVTLVTVEELAELDGASASGTHNTGGTFGTATCPASVGTAFSFTD